MRCFFIKKDLLFTAVRVINVITKAHKSRRLKMARYTKADYWRQYDLIEKYGHIDPDDSFSKSLYRKLQRIASQLSAADRRLLWCELHTMAGCEYWNGIVAER